MREREREDETAFYANEIFRFMFLSHRHRMLYVYLLLLTKMYRSIKIVKLIGKVCISSYFLGLVFASKEFCLCVSSVLYIYRYIRCRRMK